MDHFEYVFLLTSIVLATGIERILYGIGWILQNRQEIKIYWVHLLWGLNVFLYLVLNWWILYRWNTVEQWNFFLALFVLISPIVTFLLCSLLFPHHPEDIKDLKTHFFANKKWFFLLASLLPLIDALDTYLKGYQHFIQQGIVYFLTIPLLFCLNLIAAFSKNEKYQKAYAVFFLLYLLAFISVNLNTLG
jgi:hypothetical protein